MALRLVAAFGRLMDVCWPRQCAVMDCRRPADRPGRHLCSACFAAIPFIGPGGACETCGAPFPSSESHAFVCDECRRHPPAFDRARSAARYAPPVDELVKAFKFGRRALWLRADLVDLLEGVVRARFDSAAIDAVLPVPLHRSRSYERGYNQSALLARDLAARLGRRYDASSLVRVRATGHQARLGAAARRRNLVGAFAVAAPALVRRRTILLVDDVMTTGATLSGCAAALKEAGAARVWCATVARAVPG